MADRHASVDAPWDSEMPTLSARPSGYETPDGAVQRQADIEWAETHAPALVTAYRHEWIAVRGQAVVAHDPNLRALLAVLVEQGIAPGRAHLLYVDPDRRVPYQRDRAVGGAMGPRGLRVAAGARFHADAVWFHEHAAALRAAHPDEWVAVIAAAVTDHDSDLRTLLARLGNAGFDPGRAYIKFLAAPDPEIEQSTTSA